MPLNLPTASRRLRRLAAILLILGGYMGATALLAQRYDNLPSRTDRKVEIRDGWFYRNGEKFLVKAVGYDSTRPGELPWARRRSQELLESDFSRIRAAGFNTIRTWEVMSPGELAEAERQGLAVIMGIWVDPKGDFADPTFRRDAVKKVGEMARAVRSSRAILAYLVMNEPEPGQVLKAGIESTRELLRELAAAVKAEDSRTPVGFASWPGLEFFDEPSLDFVAANLYPFRPSALNKAVGYQGMVHAWKLRAAAKRPLIVTEYGVSVAPSPPEPERSGGITEVEQATVTPQLAEAVMRSGAAGGSVFMWIDGWWKNNEIQGDEYSHDPKDGEEWFGLNAMDQPGDTVGRPRPVLITMHGWNQAVLTLPADGPVAAREVEVEAHVETAAEVKIEVSLNHGPSLLLPTVREGPWLRGRLGLLSAAKGAQHALFTISDTKGPIARAERILIPPGEGASLKLAVTSSGATRTVTATVRDSTGQPVSGVSIHLAVTEASHRFDRSDVLTTGANGQAVLTLSVPPAPAVLYVVASLPAAGTEVPLALDWTFISSKPSL